MQAINISAVIGCMLFFLCCSSKKVNPKDIQPLSFSAEIGSWKTIPPKHFLSVITTLTNNTSDTLHYISMSCSWQDAYTTDTKNVSVYIAECYKNVPLLIAIPPHKQEQRTLALVTEKAIGELRKLKFRLGFNWVTASDYGQVFDKANQLQNMNNVVWSNTLEVQ